MSKQTIKTRRNGKTADARKALLAKVHIGKKELGYDDATYRDVLWRVTGKTSSGKMNISELQAVIKDMAANGFNPKANKYGKKPNVTAKRKALIGKIEAMLADMGLHWNYAHGMAKQMFKIQRVEWLNDNQLYKLTQALSVHQKREEKTKNTRVELRKKGLIVHVFSAKNGIVTVHVIKALNNHYKLLLDEKHGPALRAYKQPTALIAYATKNQISNGSQ